MTVFAKSNMDLTAALIVGLVMVSILTLRYILAKKHINSLAGLISYLEIQLGKNQISAFAQLVIYYSSSTFKFRGNYHSYCIELHIKKKDMCAWLLSKDLPKLPVLMTAYPKHPYDITQQQTRLIAPISARGDDSVSAVQNMIQQKLDQLIELANELISSKNE